MPNAKATRYLAIHGVRLAYVEVGSGPTLLLIHGLGASKSDFDRQLDYFARIFRVIAVDLRGHGESDAAAPYEVERFARDCLALMEQLCLSNFAVVGHSMGGAVAQQMALYKPERISKLVLADTLPSFIPNTWSKRGMVWFRRIMMAVLGPKALSKRVAARMFPLKDQQPLRDLIANRNAHTRREVYSALLKSLPSWSVTDKAVYFTMPVLILAAEFDYFSPMEAEVFAHSLPNARHSIFLGAHHHLPLERPDEFNRAVMEFLVPGASASTLRGEGSLDWLKVDTLATPKIDIAALLPKPPKG